jgi:hypothetical protein
VKEAAGKVFGDKAGKGKTEKAAGKVQNAIGGLKDAVRGTYGQHHQRGLPVELILIIVVLVLLFGGGGGILGSQSRLLLVTVRFAQSCVCHTDSVHLVSL